MTHGVGGPVRRWRSPVPLNKTHLSETVSAWRRPKDGGRLMCPTAFKNMPTRNGRIIPGSLLMNPIRQSLAKGEDACARTPLA